MLHRKGFSLVELSIVLVILGLLTGGILTGQNLIRAAELRSVTTDFQAYQTAAQTFRDKYFALPGDMPNATDFWGSATCPTAAGTGTETCDGNGDGDLDFPAAANQYGELFTFWQHLANAGLIKGSYTGIAGADVTDAILGQNVPRAKLGNAGWAAHTYDNSDGSLVWPFHLDFGNNFIIGADCSGNQYPRCPLFTPEEAWNIDTKMDDGMPAQGKIVVDGNGSVANCTDTPGDDDTVFTGPYQLNNDSVACSLRFRDAF